MLGIGCEREHAKNIHLPNDIQSHRDQPVSSCREENDARIQSKIGLRIYEDRQPLCCPICYIGLPHWDNTEDPGTYRIDFRHSSM